MHIDPTARFWIGIVVTLAIAISGGTVSLTNVIPHDLIPYATGWCSVIAFLGSAVLTGMNGLATTTQSRVASAAVVPNAVNAVAEQVATNRSETK